MNRSVISKKEVKIVRPVGRKIDRRLDGKEDKRGIYLGSFEKMNVTNAPNVNTLKNSIKEIELAMKTHKLSPHNKGTTTDNGDYLSPPVCTNCED